MIQVIKISTESYPEVGAFNPLKTGALLRTLTPTELSRVYRVTQTLIYLCVKDSTRKSPVLRQFLSWSCKHNHPQQRFVILS